MPERVAMLTMDPGVAAVLRREGGVVHLEFFQRIDRRLKGDLVLHGIV